MKKPKSSAWGVAVVDAQLGPLGVVGRGEQSNRGGAFHVGARDAAPMSKVVREDSSWSSMGAGGDARRLRRICQGRRIAV